MKKKNIIAIMMTAIGIALITTALVIVYASYPPRGNTIDAAITDYFYDTRSDTLALIMYIITWLGESLVYIGMLLFLYYLWDKKRTFRTMSLLITSSVVNVSAKAIFRLERPPDYQHYEHIEELSSGLPSGHAQLSTTVWGMLGIFLKKVMIVFAILLPLLIGFSRIYLGVHWFTDVIMGYGIALIILALYIFLGEYIENFLNEKSAIIKILVAIAVCAIFAILVIFLLLNRVENDTELISGSLKLIVLLVTLSISYSVEGSLINFSNEIDKWWKYLVRILIGGAIFGIFYFGVSMLFDLAINAVAWVGIELTLDLIRYAMLGPALLLLAPWIMMKLKV
ncbi:MAG: phosphatase PAP2 family protein [Candidatus Heimdallarchaeota archaeon]|nr:phosphatase PAP2 family protein [Candidatus Heimdallarchaeota archaeon]